jgi:predicted HTH transcriptional regulator
VTSDTPPEIYLAEIEERFPGALTSQFIPSDRELWKVTRYADFLSARRALLARGLNEYLDALISKPEPVKHRPVSELIELGEGFSLEFKATWQWDIERKQANRILRLMCLKSVASFLNCEGGILLIGVKDDGSIYGLSNDLRLANGSLDIFQQQVMTAISKTMSLSAAHSVHLRFEKVLDELVCVLDVDPSPEPVFTETERGREFYCRVGNMTRSLNPQEAHEYITQHWT